MSRTYTNSLAAVAAIFLAFTSIGTIVTVPDSSMQVAATEAGSPIAMAEIA